MEQMEMNVEILPNYFLRKDGTFDKREALLLCGKIAGVCYNREGFHDLMYEAISTTQRRVNRTLNSGHHSVYDHVNITFNITNIPKILAMVLNNEKQYTTSEKSARYTPVEPKEGSIITQDEVSLYNKWINIFKTKIKAQYGHIHNDDKIEKLAQENGRYLVTVFMPTNMIYTTSLRQINYLISWMQKYIEQPKKDVFQFKLAQYMKDFIECLYRKNVYVEELTRNEKQRELSLFSKNMQDKREYYYDSYSTIYEGSLAQLAQAHRHRTIHYEMAFLENDQFFVPPILMDEPTLVLEWLRDCHSIVEVMPQGQLVTISEQGKYEDFILKAKERLCSAAQLEVCNQTKKTLQAMKAGLEAANHPLQYDIVKYMNGARCTFADFTCSSPCHFDEGIALTRKI
ncbi:MAG: FAD-dependent thymidylate synthase [Bacilli bacterium]|nr:FAD-dependent thymidylate synthase [Bacilli bacterium]